MKLLMSVIAMATLEKEAISQIETDCFTSFAMTLKVFKKKYF